MEYEDFKVVLAGIELEHPVMLGAGPCKLIDGNDGVEALVRSAVSAIMVGSITREARTGYGGNDYFKGSHFSLNARGLPNPGIDYYRKHLPTMISLAHEKDKPLFVSVAGFSSFEYAIMTHLALTLGADLVELNLSCPNLTEGNDYFESPVCYKLGLVRLILERIKTIVEGSPDINEPKIAVKLSYFPDWTVLASLAEVIQEFKMVRAITAINALPLAYGYGDDGRPLISMGFGGLSGGPAIKLLGLGQVKLLREMCPPEIDIIGCGGITTGRDVADYLRAGAKAVQVVTAFCNEGVAVFSRLLGEFVNVVEMETNS